MKINVRAFVLAAFFLGLLTLLLHGGTVGTGWRYDDPAHLRFVATHSVWQYFGMKEVMLAQSYAHITPWNALFYELGLPLFGLNARGHHAHLLVVIWATALATWGFLTEQVGLRTAWAGSALFLVMPPIGAVALQLMTGHYAYGLLFVVLALWCWSRAVRSSSMGWASSAAFFYALASLCKELFVPLPAIFLFWPGIALGIRWRLMMPVGAVATAYLVLRMWVLGGVGGYAAPSGPADVNAASLVTLAIETVSGFIHTALGVGVGGWLALVLSLGLILVGIRERRPTSLLFWCAIGSALLLPILPVIWKFGQTGSDGRILIAVAWTIAVVLAWSVPAEGGWPRYLLIALVLVLAINQRQDVAAMEGSSRIQQLENQFVLEGGADHSLAPDRYMVVGYLVSMAEARRLVQKQKGPSIVSDEGQLAALDADTGRATWTADPACGCLRQLGTDWDVRAAAFNRGLELGHGLKPAMTVVMRLQSNGRFKQLSWAVTGPQGRIFLEVPQFGRWEATNNGTVTFGVDATIRLDDTITVRAVIETAEGGLLRSPLFELPTTGTNSRSWDAAESGY